MTGNTRKTARKRWTPNEINYLKRNFGKRRLEELSQELGRDIPNIRVAVYALGLTKIKRDIRPRR